MTTDDEALATLLTKLVHIKVYVVWYNEPYASEVGNDGEEFGVDRKEMLAICSSRKRAEAFIEKRCGLQQFGNEFFKSCYKKDEHEIEEEELQ